MTHVLVEFLLIILIGLISAAFGYKAGYGQWDELYPAIAHGDAEHRLWLKLAIDAVREKKSVPPFVETK